KPTAIPPKVFCQPAQVGPLEHRAPTVINWRITNVEEWQQVPLVVQVWEGAAVPVFIPTRWSVAINLDLPIDHVAGAERSQGCTGWRKTNRAAPIKERPKRMRKMPSRIASRPSKAREEPPRPYLHARASFPRIGGKSSLDPLCPFHRR